MFRLITDRLHLLCLWFLLSTLPSLAQEKAAAAEAVPRKGPTHDVIDEATLRKQVENAARLNSQVAAQTKPLFDKPPSTESSLLTSSILLFDGEKYTIVPIGSVLNLPAPLRSRVVAKPQGDFLMWPGFLKRNATWLVAKEVTLAMSRGDTKAAAAVMRELSGDNHLVVAVYKDGPITILEPRPNKEVSGAK